MSEEKCGRAKSGDIGGEGKFQMNEITENLHTGVSSWKINTTHIEQIRLKHYAC